RNQHSHVFLTVRPFGQGSEMRAAICCDLRVADQAARSIRGEAGAARQKWRQGAPDARLPVRDEIRLYDFFRGPLPERGRETSRTRLKACRTHQQMRKS